MRGDGYSEASQPTKYTLKLYDFLMGKSSHRKSVN
jgi:hypothetical protein